MVVNHYLDKIPEISISKFFYNWYIDVFLFKSTPKFFIIKRKEFSKIIVTSKILPLKLIAKHGGEKLKKGFFFKGFSKK